MRGHSLRLDRSIAFANGVRPGDKLTVPLVGTNQTVSVIWRVHSLNRRVEVGRLSTYLRSLELEAGREVVIVPTASSVEVLVEEKDSASDPEKANDTRTSGSRAESPPEHTSDPFLELLQEAD